MKALRFSLLSVGFMTSAAPLVFGLMLLANMRPDIALYGAIGAVVAGACWTAIVHAEGVDEGWKRSIHAVLTDHRIEQIERLESALGDAQSTLMQRADEYEGMQELLRTQQAAMDAVEAARARLDRRLLELTKKCDAFNRARLAYRLYVLASKDELAGASKDRNQALQEAYEADGIADSFDVAGSSSATELLALDAAS